MSDIPELLEPSEADYAHNAEYKRLLAEAQDAPRLDQLTRYLLHQIAALRLRVAALEAAARGAQDSGPSPEIDYERIPPGLHPGAAMNRYVLMKTLELVGWNAPDGDPATWLSRVERFADILVAAERERCAKLVENTKLVQRGGFPGSADYPDPAEIADVIRKGP